MNLENYEQFKFIDKLVMHISDSHIIRIGIYAGILFYTVATFDVWHTDKNYENMVATNKAEQTTLEGEMFAQVTNM